MMTEQEMLVRLTEIGGISFTIIQALKPMVKAYFASLENLSDNSKALLWRLISVVLCIGMVFLAGPELNLFIGTRLAAELWFIGQGATGIAAGLGTEAVYLLHSYLKTRLVTIPTMEALSIKVQAAKIASTVPESKALEAEVKAESV